MNYVLGTVHMPFFYYTTIHLQATDKTMPNGHCGRSGRKQDPVWLLFDRIAKGKGFRANCKNCKQEIQGLVSRMKKHVENCQPTNEGK